MATLKTVTFTLDDLSANLNIGKDLLALELYNAGLLSEEQARAIREDYAILAIEKGLLGRALDKLLFNKEDKDDTIKLQLVQVNNIKYNNKENEDVNQSEDGDPTGVDSGD
jgi:hypothetical protein